MSAVEPPPANVTRLLVLANAIVAILMGFAGSEARGALLFWAGLVPALLFWLGARALAREANHKEVPDAGVAHAG